MPRKNRINLSVDDEMDLLLDELAELTNIPKATLIVDILVDVKPLLKNIRKALKNAKKNRANIPVFFAETASFVNSETAKLNKDLADLLTQQDWISDND